jgi:hypothetical protein
VWIYPHDKTVFDIFVATSAGTGSAMTVVNNVPGDFVLPTYSTLRFGDMSTYKGRIYGYSNGLKFGYDVTDKLFINNNGVEIGATSPLLWTNATILYGQSDGLLRMSNYAGTFGGNIKADAANSFRFRNLADNDDAVIAAKQVALSNKLNYISPSTANYGVILGNGTNDGGQIQFNTSSNDFLFYDYDGSTKAGLSIEALAMTGALTGATSVTGTTVTASTTLYIGSTPLTSAVTGTVKMLYSGNGWLLSGDQQYSLVVNSVKSGKITVGFHSTPTAVTFAANPGDASKTCVGCRPAKRHILGISIKITTAGTNCASIDVGDGVDVDRYGAAISVADNTYVDIDDATADPSEFLTADGDVVITANGGNCYGLVAQVVANTINYQAQTVD